MTEMGLQPPTDLPDDAVMIDVRELDEWVAGHAPQAIHIPLGDLPARLGVARDRAAAVDLPQWWALGAGRAVAGRAGLRVVNVDGGMKQWAADGKPVVAEQGGPGVVL